METVEKIASETAAYYISLGYIVYSLSVVLTLQQRLKDAGIESVIEHGYCVRHNKYGYRHVWLRVLDHVIDIYSYILLHSSDMDNHGAVYMKERPPADIDLIDRDTEEEKHLLQRLESDLATLFPG